MYKEPRNSLKRSSTSPKEVATIMAGTGTPPTGKSKGRRSRSGSRDLSGEVTTRRPSVELMETGELSPLKQFQRMKENGSIRLLPRNRKSIDGNQSDPSGDASAASATVSSSSSLAKSGAGSSATVDRDSKRYLRLSMTMGMNNEVPSRRNSSICVTGAADLNGGGPSLLRISSEANIHTGSRRSPLMRPGDSSGNVSNCTDMSVSSTASSTAISRASSQSLHRPPIAGGGATRSKDVPSSKQTRDPKEVILQHILGGGDPVYGTCPIKPVITAAEHPVSRRKSPSALGARTSATLPLEKPVIEVKLIRNDRPRSSYRMSKSAEQLDKADDDDADDGGGMADRKYLGGFLARHAGSSLRNSFIERKRTSICNSSGDVQDPVVKVEPPTIPAAPVLTDVTSLDGPPTPTLGDEEIYSLPQPQSYSDDTLKAVKKITDKYDTLQMRKLRALSFRESNKSTSSEPASPVAPSDGDQTDYLQPPSVDGTDSGRGRSPTWSDEISPDRTPQPSPEPVRKPPTVTASMKKPPLPPVPPPGSRASAPTSASPRVVDPAPHLSVVDPDAVEDSGFMIHLQEKEAKAKLPVPEVQVRRPPEPEPNTEGEEVVCVTSGITQKDISRIDLFFRSRESEVVVCQCLADMTMGTADSATGAVDVWSSVCHTGVPVLVLNTGLGKRRRELFIVLAERETGFPLWQDRVNYLTNYKEIKPTMHQLQPSSNLRLRVGFRFYCTNAAAEFISQYSGMTSDPKDDLWKVASSRLDRNRRALLKKLWQKKRPAKADISQPCNFAHVTKLDTKDFKIHYESVRDLKGGQSPMHGGTSKDFRPRLQTT